MNKSKTELEALESTLTDNELKIMNSDRVCPCIDCSLEGACHGGYDGYAPICNVLGMSNQSFIVFKHDRTLQIQEQIIIADQIMAVINLIKSHS